MADFTVMSTIKSAVHNPANLIPDYTRRAP